MTDQSKEHLETFCIECDELIQALESGLSDLRDGVGDEETVHAVFRAVHSIKGGAAAFGFDILVNLSHRFETALGRVRDAAAPPPAFTLDIFLQAADTLADLVTAMRVGGKMDHIPLGPVLARLDQIAGIEPEAQPGPGAEARPNRGGAQGYLIRFKPYADLYQRGNETTLLLRALSELGRCQVECDTSELPTLAHIEADEAALSWTLRLSTDATEEEIEEIFEFAADDCDLTIQVVEDMRGGAAPRTGAPPLQPRSSAPPAQTIRVDVDRIERVINLVGELSIAQGMLSQRAQELGLQRLGALSESMDDFRTLTRDIQDSVMAIRAQPVKPLFQRMTRIVREAAEVTEKSVRLITEGETTEIDKTIVERLSDPLTHMIRNAVDHGIESTEARRSAGKDEEGWIKLSASHRSGRIVIEIQDDGSGVDRDRVRAIAMERGLIAEGVALTDFEIDNMIFAPGFSTAKTVTDLSGRGVGLDVVRNAIQALGGRTQISSIPGRGTTFTISLPLTLAVLEGVIASVAGQTVIAPLTSIVETFNPKPQDVRRLGSGARVALVRGAPVPVIDVGVALGYRASPRRLDQSTFVITDTEAGPPHALVVDEIFDQRQVVIKSLEANYRATPGISAATIMGDGRIGLILDVDVLVARASAGEDLSGAPMALAG